MVRLDPAMNLERICGEGSADGFIIFDGNLPSLEQQDYISAAMGSSIPFVLLDTSASFPFDSVSTDNQGGGELAAGHLSRVGSCQCCILWCLRSCGSRGTTCGVSL